MIAAVHQPQYLPWLGYFDKIDRADVFVLLDTVQYKKNEFQNRNKIKTAQNWQWLTVPVKYHFPQTIEEVPINNTVNWAHKHNQALLSNYAKSPYFSAHKDFFNTTFAKDWEWLTNLNTHTVTGLIECLGISTPVERVTDWELSEDPTGRLVDICKQTGAETYLSGAGGQEYLDMPQFEAAGIDVIFQTYQHPEYAQRFGEFEPYMSVVDLLFNCGPESLEIIRSGR